MLDMALHKGLLKIYYNFRNIDFTQDILDELHIKGDRVIDKKVKREERYDPLTPLNIGLCLRDMIDARTEEENKRLMGFCGRVRKSNRGYYKNRELVLRSTLYSKGSNMARVRGNYSKGN
jgi:hypothetical protein